MSISSFCIKCRGKGWCGKPCEILSKFRDNAPKVKTHFSGLTPPEIFVGRVGYPHINAGILSPVGRGHEDSSSAVRWVGKKKEIDEILQMRGQMVYGREKSHIKSTTSIKPVVQELAMASRSVSTEFFLSKLPRIGFSGDSIFSIRTNPAPLKKAIIEDNVKVEKKVDYLVSDYDVKANTALRELYSSKIHVENMQKLLAAGLLGVKTQRRMVPTRWSITAVDDMLGKKLLEKIRTYPELNRIELWHFDYNGNHFEVLLLPGSFSFEVIEVSVAGGFWGNGQGDNLTDYFMQDWEGFEGRKSYAKNVVGAYYTDRLACCEYLERIGRQAQVLVFHEERPEYYAPLGVGIIRESLRKMFSGFENREIPATKEEALLISGMRLKADIKKYKSMSWILENYGKQRKLKDFLS
jgi:hypothetical protein